MIATLQRTDTIKLFTLSIKWIINEDKQALKNLYNIVCGSDIYDIYFDNTTIFRGINIINGNLYKNDLCSWTISYEVAEEFSSGVFTGGYVKSTDKVRHEVYSKECKAFNLTHFVESLMDDIPFDDALWSDEMHRQFYDIESISSWWDLMCNECEYISSFNVNDFSTRLEYTYK